MGIFQLIGYGTSGQSVGGSNITFPFELASAPTVDEIHNGVPNSHYAGSGAAPTPAPGYPCIYVAQTGNITLYQGVLIYGRKESAAAGADRSGALRSIEVGSPSIQTWARDSWAVTAP